MRDMPLFSYLCWTQGVYYALTGIWPIVSVETFQMVTGRKTDHLVRGREADHWLVMTVGVLVTAVAITLLVDRLAETKSHRSSRIGGFKRRWV